MAAMAALIPGRLTVLVMTLLATSMWALNAEAAGRKLICVDNLFCIGNNPFKEGWCVAKPDTNPADLQSMLQRACSQGVGCLPIEPGQACHDPDTLLAHTSWAINAYYSQKLGHCDWEGHAQIVNQDPSSGTCKYPHA